MSSTTNPLTNLSQFVAGTAQANTVRVFAMIPDFNLEDEAMVQLLIAHWTVARRGSDEGEVPSTILLRSAIHGTTITVNTQTNTREVVPDDPHITTSWTTPRLFAQRKFRTAHGYIADSDDPDSSIKIKSIKFASEKDSSMATAMYRRANRLYLIWPQRNDECKIVTKAALNAELPDGWETIPFEETGRGPRVG